MTPRATIYSFDVTLSDNDRTVYEQFKVTVAQHQSETVEFMLTRLLAYCLEYREGITFSKGLDNPDEPALWAHSLDGRCTLWVEVGSPSAEKLHKASKSGAEVAVYTHRNPAIILSLLEGTTIYQSEKIPIISFSAQFLENLSSQLDKRSVISVTVNEKILYVEMSGSTYEATIEKSYLSRI